MSTKTRIKILNYLVDNPKMMLYTWFNNQRKERKKMAELNKDIKDVKEFAEIIKSIKGTGKEYKDFVAGAIAGARMAHSMEKKAG